MPKRSRSHQLETESLKRFEQTLPDRWVCRRKNDDYGVDLEVEIFDDRDEATGLIFFVQMKATDRAAEARSVSMKMDRLDYLAKLDCPSILVRYCSVKNDFHWKWISNVFADIGNIDTKTVTIRFSESDAWSGANSEAIVRTLQVYRTIRRASRHFSLGLTIDQTSGADHSFELSSAVAEITSSCRIVRNSSDPGDCLPVAVHLDGDCLLARIDVIASITVHLKSFDRHEIAAQLCYVLACFASGYEFAFQARELATLIRQRGYKCQSRQIAAVVAARLTEHPSLAGELAALNGLHECQDQGYLHYIHNLLSSSLPFDERLGAVSKFYTDALEFHASDNPERQATIHYSFGNALRVAGAMSAAVRQYNLARRKFPEYLERGYFLAELAASLYFRGRYRMAAKLYAQAYQCETTPQVAICAGDTHLFSGQFCEAKKYYDFAVASDNNFESAEAALKVWMATWMQEFSDRSQITHGWANPRLWTSALDESVLAERRDDAIGACLALCFLTDDNVDLWAKAISLAVGCDDPGLIIAVLTSAVWVHGQSAYGLFRDYLVERGGLSDALRNLDKMVGDLYAQRASISMPGVTARLLREHHYDSVVDVATSP